MRHLEISVSAIHPNPHRDFERNPIRDDQVERIMESIDRTGFWDNVVVRERPGRRDQYQLAYGHSRLEAVRRKGITEVCLPVAELTDWDMYQAMRDENETQQEITPAIAFENVEVGVCLIERAFRAIGPEGTWEEFNGALGRGVSADTPRRDHHDHGFEQARNHWFIEGTIGRKFITEVLEPRRLPGNTINTVLQSHYGRRLEEAKRKEAAAKAREAEAKAREARAARDREEAARLRAEAGRAQAEADHLAAEAKRIGAGTVAQEILLSFKHNRQMTDFATAIREVGIPKDRHRDALNRVLEAQVYGRGMIRTLNAWWHVESGAYQAEQRQRLEREFSRYHRGGDFWAFVHALRGKIEEVIRDMDKVKPVAARMPDLAGTGRPAACRMLTRLIDRAAELRGEFEVSLPAAPGNGRPPALPAAK